MPCDSVLDEMCGLGWSAGELRDTRFPEFARQNIFLVKTFFSMTRICRRPGQWNHTISAELGPDSAMPVPAQYKKLRHVPSEVISGT
jgi:hypothetical protein